MASASDFEAAKLRSSKATLKMGTPGELHHGVAEAVFFENVLGLKPETLEALKTAGETFGMVLASQEDQLCLSAQDIELLVRKGHSEDEDWLVFAFPILNVDDEDAKEVFSYFSVLSHQTAHSIDFPMIFGMNPRSRDLEVLLQVHIESMGVEEMTHLMAVFIESVRHTLQVHE
jgi:hypothetical protein